MGSGGEEDLAVLSDLAAEVIAGHDVTVKGSNRPRVGYVFQDFNLIPALTAAENVALPLELT